MFMFVFCSRAVGRVYVCGRSKSLLFCFYTMGLIGARIIDEGSRQGQGVTIDDLSTLSHLSWHINYAS